MAKKVKTKTKNAKRKRRRWLRRLIEGQKNVKSKKNYIKNKYLQQ